MNCSGADMHDTVLYHPTLSCRSCGSHVVEVKGELMASSAACCRRCGAPYGTWQSLVERAQVRRKVRDFIRPFHAHSAEAR
jgi:hypothetical protein